MTDDLDITEPMRLPRRAIYEDCKPYSTEELESLLAAEKSFGRGSESFAKAIETEIKKRKGLGS